VVILCLKAKAKLAKRLAELLEEGALDLAPRIVSLIKDMRDRPLALPRIPLKARIRRAINPPAAVPIRDRIAAIVAGLHGVCSVLPIDAVSGIVAA
jgi:hypothetical protein